MQQTISNKSNALRRIHDKAITAKNDCFFVGFLQGILSNDRLDQTELEPLLAECAAMCRQVRDEDAAEIIEEASAGHEHTVEELLELLKQVVEIRARKIDLKCCRSSANRLLGFCAGVNCDSVITTKEAEALYSQLRGEHDLEKDPRVAALMHSLRDSLEDGRIDPPESEEISQLITALVGDSYADTGIPSSETVPVVHDLDEIDAAVLEGAQVVITGAFSFGARLKVAARLEEYGASVQRSPTAKTNVVIIGSEGSPYYTHKHHGGKLAKALKLRSKGLAPRIYVEGQLASIFRS